MISLGGLVSQKAFGKFEMGKVISNPFANAFIKEAEGEDHEVSMGQNQLDTIIKMATELKAKMGENEKEIPAWIQDHISKAENYISQASGNYHEYGTNEDVNEVLSKDAIIRTLTRDKSQYFLEKDGNGWILHITPKAAQQSTFHQKFNVKDLGKGHLGMKYKLTNESSIKEESPCWKGYKQVGMKDKNGRQVPNCVPNESVVKEISGRTPKIFVKTAAVEKKIKELMADRKKAVVPYNKETDPKKKEILKQILIKLTNQIKGYEKNLVQLRDMEEEYLQQMHADAELDTSDL